MRSASSRTVALLHLAAALIGLVLAIALRRLDITPRKRYAWEDEEDEYEDT